MDYRAQARDFVENETQFQLGFLVTESSHPRTRDLGETTAASSRTGVARLLSVDEDISAASRRLFGGRR